MTDAFRFRRLDLRSPDAATLASRDALFRRGAVPDPKAREAARTILADIRLRGASAVRDASARFGGGRPDGRLLLTRPELAAAASTLAPAVRDALEAAIANVRRLAETQRPSTTRTTIIPGVEIERRWLAVSRVGAYVPGGSAPYPSSLVMSVVPARVAGVAAVVVASPADRSGEVNPTLLGAAGLLGVDAVLVAGGAQAVAALAYGLPEEGLAPVDLIVGPGNAWVTAAASGLVVRSGSGMVVIDLDGDGREQTGWVLIYLHLAVDGRIALNTWVATGDPLGHPSCEGGFATGTHLHIARKFNGEWVQADGPLPFNLGGWVAQAGSEAYEGTLTRDGVTVTACVCGNADSFLTRTANDP